MRFKWDSSAWERLKVGPLPKLSEHTNYVTICKSICRPWQQDKAPGAKCSACRKGRPPNRLHPSPRCLCPHCPSSARPGFLSVWPEPVCRTCRWGRNSWPRSLTVHSLCAGAIGAKTRGPGRPTGSGARRWLCGPARPGVNWPFRGWRNADPAPLLPSPVSSGSEPPPP